MKKKLFCLLLILLLPVCVLFTGCSTRSNDYQENISERFVIVEKVQTDFREIDSFVVDIFIIVDKETKIMYLVFSGYEKLGIEIMLDVDGMPMIWEGEV